ncbi:MAG: divalent metal cation transporter [Chloroflexi bacterium]|nr:divalent metal cation transporter [Chloroflexota bacterium]
MDFKKKKSLRKPARGLRKLFKMAIPSIITGGAGDDPAGVLTYTTVGATTGFSQLWLLVITTPMLVASISMAERIARTTRIGLIAVLRDRYGRIAAGLMMVLLLIANISVISADVSAVSEVLQILTGIRWEWFVPVILGVLFLLLRKGYARTRRILTFFALGLLVYALSAFMARPDWGKVLQSMVLPQVILKRTWMLAALGLIGATVSPYMLFWQGDEEIEELRHGSSGSENNQGAIWGGMIFSNVVALFIIIAAAMVLHGSGGQISTVLDAAKALSPLGKIGDLAFILGILGAGFLALPVFAGSTAFAVAEFFGWREGLDEPVDKAKGYYFVLGATLLGGAIISLIPNFNPTDALFYSQVLNGILLPVIMVVLLMLSNDQKVVGTYRNPLWVNLVGVFTIFVALAANLAALFG